MEEETIEPPPGLDIILHRVKPLYRFNQTPENPDGRLHYVQNGDPDHAFSYNPIKEGEACDVRQLTEVEFKHSTSEKCKFAPTMREIVHALFEQLPKEQRDRVYATEVVLDLESIQRQDNHYLGKAILYEKV